MKAKRACVLVNGLTLTSSWLLRVNGLTLTSSWLLRQTYRKSYKFTLLHVQQPLCVSAGPAYILSSEVIYLLELDAVRTTQRILNRALDVCNDYNVEAEAHVVIGEPRVKICETVEKMGAHFLVMGSHGHCLFIRLIKGSVSDYYLRNVTCPPVVVNKKSYKD